MSDEVFTDAERAIFRYQKCRGGRVVTVCADPMVLHRRFRLALAGKQFGTLIEESKSDDEAIALPAAQKLSEVFQATFGVPGLDEDGNGMLDDQLFTAWNDLMDFFQRRDAQAASLPKTSPSGEVLSSGDGSSPIVSTAV